MSLRVTQEMHERRFGRNLGVALLLAGFIAVVFGLTVVKVTSGGFEPPRAPVSEGE